MSEVSKSFVNAMNGVLKGEKWTRKSCDYVLFKDNYGDICIYKTHTDCSQYNLDDKDMQATDWKKVG